MGIGASIFLIALGAILAFALNFDATQVGSLAIDWQVVGFILMAAGLVGIVLTLMVWGPRREGRVVERRVDDGYVDRVDPRI